MYANAAVFALAGLTAAAAAVPQGSITRSPVTPTTSSSSAPASTTTLAPPIARSQNFTIAVGQAEDPQLHGFVLQQAHIGAGENALIFQRPSAYTGYVSYLEGTSQDLQSGHAFLQQYLPGASSPVTYGVRVPSAGPPGTLGLVTGQPGEQSEAFGVSETQGNRVTYYTFERDTTFYACKDSVNGVKDSLFLKYGAVTAASPAPQGCKSVQLVASYNTAA